MKKTDKTNIFEFNLIDKSLTESEVGCLKDFYKHYHKKCWCFKKSYKRYKKLDETLAITGRGLIVVGTITGGITLNPLILGIINGAGVIYCGKSWKNKELQEEDGNDSNRIYNIRESAR